MNKYIMEKVGRILEAARVALNSAASAVAFFACLAMLSVPAHAAYDLTDVTDEITLLKGDILTAAVIAITAGIALMAVKFGGRWLVRLFKSFSR